DVPVSAVVLDEAICLRRLQYVDHSTNQIIRVAAGEIGKSWSPRYGNTWEKMSDPKPLWCSEFASWAIREGTNGRLLNVPIYDRQGTNNLILYFLKHTAYITSNSTEEHPLTDKEAHIIVNTFAQISATIKAGYYVPMFGDTEEPWGTADHSGLFISWQYSSMTNPHQIKFFKTIEGNWDDVVQPMIRYACASKNYEFDGRAPIIWSEEREIPMGNNHLVNDGFGKAQ
ncbi:MAG: hypothetical protein GX444_21705, partial [Myxococcales bacterium]|nr:hypothetical protein [Myxococcales bacterium]